MRRGKDEKDCFFLEGPHLLESALAAGIRLKALYVSEQASKSEGLRSVLNSAAKRSVPEHLVSDRIMEKIADTESPQGIAAIAERPARSLSEIEVHSDSFILICDSIQDPGNLGSLIRSADAAGFSAVILLPGSCDPYAPKVLRSTAGSIFNLPVVMSTLAELRAWLNKNGIRLAVADAHKGRSLFEADIAGPLAIALGSEAHGIGEGLKAAADLMVSIPLLGKAESLNVAAAGAVIMFEAARRRRPAQSP